MYLPAPTGNDFELAPAGTHLATCYRIIDLGTQKSVFSGKEKEQHKILISWELADEFMEDGKPFIIGQRYTWSMSEKATLRKHLESWRGKAFDDAAFAGPPNGFNIRSILGKSCILTVAHKQEGESTYANITGIGKLMKGMNQPAPVNAQMFLWLEAGAFEMNAFNFLSEGLKKIIEKSPEYTALTTRDGRPTHDIAGRPIPPAPAASVLRPLMSDYTAGPSVPQDRGFPDMNDEIPF